MFWAVECVTLPVLGLSTNLLWPDASVQVREPDLSGVTARGAAGRGACIAILVNACCLSLASSATALFCCCRRSLASFCRALLSCLILFLDLSPSCCGALLPLASGRPENLRVSPRVPERDWLLLEERLSPLDGGRLPPDGGWAVSIGCGVVTFGTCGVFRGRRKGAGFFTALGLCPTCNG